MHTIDIDSAKRQFHGAIKVGEYVAFWVSEDRQSTLAMTMGSHATAEAAEAAAEAEGDLAGIEDGSYEANLVTAED